MSTRSLIVALLFLFISHALKAKTTYLWIPSAKDIGGKCFEIDIATAGDRYRVNVPAFNCRPPQIKYLWKSSPTGIDGKCYEVSAISPKDYANVTDTSKCIGKELGISWVQHKNDYYCLKFYEGPDGEEIRKPLKESDCKPAEGRYSFSLNKDGLSGECYFVAEKFKAKEALKSCRPQEVKYVWLEDKEQCFEMHVDGPEKYVAKTNSELCIDKNLEIRFHADLTKLKFSCLQIFYTPTGEKSSRPLPLAKCKTSDLYIEFVKIAPLKGACLEIDRKEGISKYANVVSLDRCRPAPKDQEFIYVEKDQKLGDEGCFLVDKETKGEKYIEKVEKKFCAEAVTELIWLPSSDGWSGRCVKKGFVPNQPGELVFKIKDCKPKETAYLWRYIAPYRGECYEVDAKAGRLLYSDKVRSDLCRPKLLSQIKYFFYIDPKGIGSCYLVDVKTNGLEYAEKVENEKCKLNL